MINQRGGIISTIFVVPIGLVLMIGIFFLGYYVGKYKSETGEEDQFPPLPEIVSKNLPKKEEFTFFKTLSDKENKTVSIDLKPRQDGSDQKNVPVSNAGNAADASSNKEKKSEEARKAPVAKVQSAKQEPAISRSPASKLKYTLQIASYQEKQMAEDEVKKLKQKGYAAFIASSEIPGKGTWYRVRLGSFSSRPAAEKLQKELRAKSSMTPLITIE